MRMQCSRAERHIQGRHTLKILWFSDDIAQDMRTIVTAIVLYIYCCASSEMWPWALQMHVDSWFHLGVMHLNGLGVKKNLQQALNYFTSAAKYGHVLAQYNLAMLHLQNSGTEKCARTAILALSCGIACFLVLPGSDADSLLLDSIPICTPRWGR